jgi:hypothetical protein
LRVFVDVSQAYAPNMTAGLPVKVVARGRLDQPVTGTVTRTASALDPGTRTLLTLRAARRARGRTNGVRETVVEPLRRISRKPVAFLFRTS